LLAIWREAAANPEHAQYLKQAVGRSTAAAQQIASKLRAYGLRSESKAPKPKQAAGDVDPLLPKA